jgi:hypothetical protein
VLVAARQVTQGKLLSIRAAGLFVGPVVISLLLALLDMLREEIDSVKDLKNVAFATAAEQHGEPHDRVL